jgi:catechol 2,3-dioxygenase-like lactoylglutathione lyase family enzyme
MSGARAIGINHVALEVGDIDEALKFWAALVPLRLRGRSDRMAFIDLGDQFIALSAGRSGGPDTARHFGLVVDDREAIRRALAGTAARVLPGRGLTFADPWGNQVQVVEYRDVQFLKAAPVLAAMGVEDPGKSAEALDELRAKGIALD